MPLALSDLLHHSFVGRETHLEVIRDHRRKICKADI